MLEITILYKDWTTTTVAIKEGSEETFFDLLRKSENVKDFWEGDEVGEY